MNPNTIQKPVYLTKAERTAFKSRKDNSIDPMSTEQINIHNNHVPIHKNHKNMDADLIKSRYIGVNERPRKQRRIGDKKFQFDWDDADDTSITTSTNSQIHVLFGRGHLGGMDIEARHDISSDLHWTKKSLKEMNDRDWRIFKEDFNITTKGGQIPNPIRSWSESSLPKNLVSLLDQYGYQQPTPIQRQSIPIMLQNRDMIGIAETGSGKTLAFLLPILTFIQEQPKLDESNSMYGPYALVLAPTRELAQQIEREATKFGSLLGYRCISIIGGHSISEQSFHMSHGVEIVIATPGRLRDCLEQHILVLQQCKYIVMDEADRMMDMGFETDVTFILNQLPNNNIENHGQMTMFSATMPSSVERLAKSYLSRPATVTIGIAGQTVNTIEQIVEMTHSDEKKKSRLLQILDSGFEPPVIIFVNLIDTADTLCKFLVGRGFKAISLHGRKGQEQRELALNQLKDHSKDILVATDVASRGIDVPSVSLVVNYDMSKTIEDYVHRIGRTGRAGKSGTSMTFLSPDDTAVYYDLAQLLKSTKSKYPLEFSQHEASNIKPISKK